MAKKKGNNAIKVAALLFILGIGYLIFSGVSSSSIYYVNVAEALELSPERLHTARIFGTVKDGTIVEMTNKSGVSFTLEDSDNAERAIRVTYKGEIPDTFQAGSEVFVEGKLDGANKQFSATVLVTKCPSKYQKENRS